MNRRTFLAAVAVAPLAPVPNPVRPLTLGTSSLDAALAAGAFFGVDRSRHASILQGWRLTPKEAAEQAKRAVDAFLARV